MLLLRRLRWPYLVLAALVTVATVVVVAGTFGASAAPPMPTWSDEFDGAAGSAPDPSKWVHDTGGSGFGNKELEYYTGGADNAALDGQGHLVITARKENPGGYGCWYGQCQYTSARLNTSGRFSQAYGRVEARLKFLRGKVCGQRLDARRQHR